MEQTFDSAWMRLTQFGESADKEKVKGIMESCLSENRWLHSPDSKKKAFDQEKYDEQWAKRSENGTITKEQAKVMLVELSRRAKTTRAPKDRSADASNLDRF